MKFYVLLFLTAFIFASCGTAKNSGDKVVNPGEKSFTKADFEYIEKFHEGVRHKTKKEYDQALKAFNHCLTIRQNDDAVYFALAEVYRAKDDKVSAAANFRKASEIDKNNRYYVEELATILFEQGDFKGAADKFGYLVKLEPENVQWLYAYAESLLGAGLSAEAIAALNKTEDEVGINPQLSLQKYQIYMSLGQKDKAVEELKKAINAFPSDQYLTGTLIDHYFQNNETEKGIAMLTELVEKDPANGRANLILGQYALEQKDKPKALEYFTRAYASEEVEIETKIQIAFYYLDDYKAEDTLTEKLIRTLIETHPESAMAWSLYGDFMIVKDDEPKALEAYLNAVTFDKSEFSIWNQIFLIYMGQKKYEELFSTSKEAISYFPNLPQVYLYNALAANQTRRYDDALAATTMGSEVVLNDPYLKAELIGQEGEAYFGLKDYESGSAAFDRALKLTPSNAVLKNNYAYQLALANRNLEKAANLISELALDENAEAYIIDTYGYILFRQGKFTEAYTQLKRAYDKDSTDFTIVEHLGDAAIKAGKTTEALKYWQEAKELGSDNKILNQKIEKKQYYEPEY